MEPRDGQVWLRRWKSRGEVSDQNETVIVMKTELLFLHCLMFCAGSFVGSWLAQRGNRFNPMIPICMSTGALTIALVTALCNS